jgi:hypothetical protein
MFRVTSNRFALSAGLAISVDTRAIFTAVAKAWRQLHKALFDTYRPELHYMRGRGKHAQCKRLDPVRSPTALSDPVAITVENDVLRDEGEHHARKYCHLRAYASHRRDTMGHFTSSSELNALSDVPATRGTCPSGHHTLGGPTMDRRTRLLIMDQIDQPAAVISSINAHARAELRKRRLGQSTRCILDEPIKQAVP